MIQVNLIVLKISISIRNRICSEKQNLSSESKDSLGDQDLIEIPKDEDIRKCAIHLLKDDAENDIEFYKLCVNRLVGEKVLRKHLP